MRQAAISEGDAPFRRLWIVQCKEVVGEISAAIGVFQWFDDAIPFSPEMIFREPVALHRQQSKLLFGLRKEKSPTRGWLFLELGRRERAGFHLGTADPARDCGSSP